MFVLCLALWFLFQVMISEFCFYCCKHEPRTPRRVVLAVPVYHYYVNLLPWIPVFTGKEGTFLYVFDRAAVKHALYLRGGNRGILGVQLLVFFCSSVPVMLFGTPGISGCRSQHVPVESSSLLHHSIYL